MNLMQNDLYIFITELNAFFYILKGMYGIHVKFNDEHIPNSPFMVNIAPDSGLARTVTVHALKDRGLAV